MATMYQKIAKSITDWITEERPNTDFPLCDFERIRYELRPCDVLLIEGRSRVSEVIKQITQSSWSHSCLYIGRLHDIDDLALRVKLTEHFKADPDVQLVIEGYLGKGTIVSPLENYRTDHIRICRPRGLSRQDAQQVSAFAINQLGTGYDVRQLFDLARFMVPWSILPRRWRSSLFEHHVGEPTKTVCSTMIAQAFASIDFPILPVVKQHEESGIELFARNPRLFTPSDFDYSPYFEIIKYPFIAFAEGPYRKLPWNRQGLVSHDGESIIDPSKIEPKSKTKEKKSFSMKLKDSIIKDKTKKSKDLTSSEKSGDDDKKPEDSEPDLKLLTQYTPAENLYTMLSGRFTQIFRKKTDNMLER